MYQFFWCTYSPYEDSIGATRVLVHVIHAQFLQKLWWIQTEVYWCTTFKRHSNLPVGEEVLINKFHYRQEQDLPKVHANKAKAAWEWRWRKHNYVCCLECVFGEKPIRRGLWPLVSPTDPVSFLLLRCFQKEKNGNNNNNNNNNNSVHTDCGNSLGLWMCRFSTSTTGGTVGLSWFMLKRLFTKIRVILRAITDKDGRPSSKYILPTP
jgi:hypothetical protein